MSLRPAINVALGRVPPRYRPPVRKLYRSRAAQRRFVREVEDAEGIRAFCVFIGHPRSGSTLVAAMLNAHPDVVISMELDSLHLGDYRFGKRRLFALIFQADQRWCQRGRRWSGYDYAVEGQWQGRYRQLRMLGDKQAGGSSVQLRANPRLLDRLHRTVGVPLRLIQVVRNPFDNISTIAQRQDMTLPEAVAYYRRLAEGVAAAENVLDGKGTLIRIRHEALTEDPHTELGRLCDRLGLDVDEAYVQACGAIVFPSPKRTRGSVGWSARLVAEVDRIIGEFDFLGGYSFEL